MSAQKGRFEPNFVVASLLWLKRQGISTQAVQFTPAPPVSPCVSSTHHAVDVGAEAIFLCKPACLCRVTKCGPAVSSFPGRKAHVCSSGRIWWWLRIVRTW